MEMLKEMKAKGFPIATANAKTHCKVFEDNSGTLEIAWTHKFRPQTNHLNAKLHHFRSHIDAEQVTTHKAFANSQRADCLTKPVTEEILKCHHMEVMGW